jgi:colanic acid/amylovoran biosynthesis protein
MKVLLVGNHTCGNRGDGAILRGLIEGLKFLEPKIEITIVSRFPTSSEFLVGEPFLPDTLNHYHIGASGKKFIKKIKSKLLPKLLHFNLKRGTKWFLPKHIHEHLAFLKQFDAVLQVGGSFFVDLYGSRQFEHGLCALIAEKPLFLLGHSVGPFKNEEFNQIAKTVFSRAQSVALREEVSKNLMIEAQLMSERVTSGADTAWLVSTRNEIPDQYLKFFKDRPVIAITLRELKPFDKRLRIKQAEYEDAFAVLARKLISDGYSILALSTCTGIDSYTKDDRMVALRVKKLVNNGKNFNVMMDEINDLELGTLLGRCKLTIGTRLHSAIISKNFGTVAIALNYEHKSLGIMQQLGLNEFSRTVHSLFDNTLYEFVRSLLLENKIETISLDTYVGRERQTATDMLEDCIRKIKER